MSYQAAAHDPRGFEDEQMPDPMQGQAPKERGRGRSWVSILVMTFLCVLWTVPTLGLLVTSFRDRTDAVTSGWWSALFNPFGAEWTIENYDRMFAGSNMGGAFINTIVVAVPATIIPIMFAAFAAYAFTFMDFRARTSCSW